MQATRVRFPAETCWSGGSQVEDGDDLGQVSSKMLPLAGIEPGLLTMTALGSVYSTMKRFISPVLFPKYHGTISFPGLFTKIP